VSEPTPIETYLAQLDEQLRRRRLPRRRLHDEAEDHLRAAAAAALSGEELGPLEAEHRAVAQFGSAARVARSFAAAWATRGARSAVAATGAAWIACLGAGAALAGSSPVLRDFPQGVPATVGLQIGAVALVIACLRARHLRGAGLLPEDRVLPLTVAALIGASALLLSGLAELTLALTRPAGVAAWGDDPSLLALFAVALATSTIAVASSGSAFVRGSTLDALPRAEVDCLPEVNETLAADASAALPFLAGVTQVALTRPGRSCAVACVVGAVLVTALQASGDDFAHHASVVLGSAAVGVFEALAIGAGYLAFGRALGLRARRSRIAA